MQVKQVILTIMPLSWRLSFFIVAISFPLFHAAVFEKTSVPRQLDLSTMSQETAVSREYFYAGGRYVEDGSGSGQHIFRDQMYVEKLSPAVDCAMPYPLVFIHGQGQLGTVSDASKVNKPCAYKMQNWLNKPDGSPGWASYFASKGYTIYILDQTSRGRSPWKPGNGTQSTYSAEIIQQRFTAPEKYKLWPQAALHTQWPGEGVMGDEYFDAYYASNVQFLASATEQQNTVKAAGVYLLDKIGKPVILLSHSQGGIMPWLIADARPKLTKAIVSLEPTGPPFGDAVFGNGSARAYGLTDIPITYDPPVLLPDVDLVKQTIAAPTTATVPCTIQADDPAPRQLVNLKNIPVLLLTAEASYHAPYDWCTVRYLQQAGVNVEHLELSGIGIRGNGHLMFLEKNSDEVAKVVEQWMGGIEKVS
jgi:pimeloyl-ACP methyl ester carboxylesterase